MPSREESRDRHTASSLEPTTALSGRGDSRPSTSRYSSTVRSPFPKSLTKENLKKQEKLCSEAERRQDEDQRHRERSEQTYRSSPRPSRQPSQQTSRRPSEQPTLPTSRRSFEQPTSKTFAPLSHELPPNPTPRHLIREGFSPIDSNGKSHDRYRRYTTEIVGSRLFEVRDTVGIPSRKR